MSPLVYEPINGTWAEKGLGDSLVGSTAPKALNPIVNQVHRQISGVILSAEKAPSRVRRGAGRVEPHAVAA
jgi:hypothetical protein